MDIVFSTLHLQMRNQLVFNQVKLLSGHGGNLSDGEYRFFNIEPFVILVENLLRRFILQIASRAEHICGIFFQILNSGDLRHLPCRFLIQRRTGGGSKQESVRDNRGTEQPGNFLRNFQPSLMINFIHDGRSTANRLVPEHDRPYRLQRSQSVMIHYFQDFRLIDIQNRLGFFIVIHQDQLLAMQSDQISP